MVSSKHASPASDDSCSPQVQKVNKRRSSNWTSALIFWMCCQPLIAANPVVRGSGMCNDWQELNYVGIVVFVIASLTYPVFKKVDGMRGTQVGAAFNWVIGTVAMTGFIGGIAMMAWPIGPSHKCE